MARAFLASFGCLAALLGVPTAASAAVPRVLLVEFANDVNPVTADYVVEHIRAAGERGYAAVVIELDTPGGLGGSMEKIVRAELASRIPVVVYVAPPGGGAGSAGVFVAQAADVLAMAPNTAIGASTPVGQGGANLPSDVRRKAINFYAGKLRALARTHGRNAAWADAAVRRGASLTAGGALRAGVVDLVAPSVPALLERIDGRKTKPKGLVLRTAGARIETVRMSFVQRVLDLLIDPQLITVMLSIGLVGILVELWNPGLIFPGTVGAISLIVSLYGLQVLPVSAAGLLLLLLAAGFFVAEAFVPSHGALTLAGGVTFVLGALMLFDPAGGQYQVSLQVALGIAATLALLLGFAMTKAVGARRRPVEVGSHRLVGQDGVVRGGGLVFVNGELWRARSAAGAPLEPGEHVRVEDVGEDLTLVVGSPQPAEREQ